MCIRDRRNPIERSQYINNQYKEYLLSLIHISYETSILPYEDCCTIFTPKNPVTKPRVDKCKQYEARFDYEALVQECIETVSYTHLVYYHTNSFYHILFKQSMECHEFF